MQLSLYCWVLSKESLPEPEERARFCNNSGRCISFTSSCLSWPPKVSFIASMICFGSHVGRVQAVTVLWKPLMMNGALPFAKRERRCWHVGQQCFDTPITGPKPFHKKWDSDDKNKLETWLTFIRADMSSLASEVSAIRLTKQASQCSVPEKESSKLGFLSLTRALKKSVLLHKDWILVVISSEFWLLLFKLSSLTRIFSAHFTCSDPRWSNNKSQHGKEKLSLLSVPRRSNNKSRDNMWV